MPRVTPILPILAAAALLAAGCGSDGSGSGYGSRDSTEQSPTATATTPPAPPGASARSCGRATVAGAEDLRVTGVGCDIGRDVVAGWTREPSCFPTNEASRVSCTVDEDYRCLGATTDRGVAVSCARPGGSIAFVARRGDSAG